MRQRPGRSVIQLQSPVDNIENAATLAVGVRNTGRCIFVTCRSALAATAATAIQKPTAAPARSACNHGPGQPSKKPPLSTAVLAAGLITATSVSAHNDDDEHDSSKPLTLAVFGD